jgi:hypothetical protein
LPTRLIDVCLSAPTAVLYALRELEELGYDIADLVQTDINDKQILELRNISFLYRCIDLPVSDNTITRKYAD